MYRGAPTRKLVRRFYRPWYRRPFTWLLLMLPVLVAARIALTPWLEQRTRDSLARLPDHKVDFNSLRVFVLPPSIVLDGLRVHAADAAQPLLAASRVEIHLSWRDLHRDDRTVSVTIRRPEWRSGGGDAGALAPLFAALPPARIDVLAIEDGRALLPATNGRESVWLDRISARAKGLSTHAALAKAPLAEIQGRGELLGSGRLELRFRHAPWAAAPTLEGSAELRGLALRDLEGIYGGRPAGAEPSTGVVEWTGEVRLGQGRLQGQLLSRASGAVAGPALEALSSRLEASLASAAPGVAMRVAEIPAEGDGPQVARLGGEVAAPLGSVDLVLGVVRGLAVHGVGVPLRFLPVAAAPAAPSESLVASGQ